MFSRFTQYRSRLIRWCLTSLREDLWAEYKPENLPRYLKILVGSYITALSVLLFLRQAPLVAGGGNGLGLWIEERFGIATHWTYLAITVAGILFQIGAVGLGPGLRTLFGSLTYPFALFTLQWVRPVSSWLPPAVNVVLAIAGTSLGVSIVMSEKSSEGGTGPIGIALEGLYPKLTAAEYLFLIDFTIVLIQAPLKGWGPVMLGGLFTFGLWVICDMLIPWFSGNRLCLFRTGNAAAVLRALRSPWSPALFFPGRWGLPLGVWVPVREKLRFWEWLSALAPDARPLAGSVAEKPARRYGLRRGGAGRTGAGRAPDRQGRPGRRSRTPS